MAAPNNLSLQSPFSSSTQQQSLKTPDANSLFSSSSHSSLPTPHDISLPNDVSSVNSLEDLLSFSGITNGPPPSKRQIEDVELPNSKKIKCDTQSLDIGPSQSTASFIPSILPSSKPHLPTVNSTSHLLSINSSSLNGSVLPKQTLSLPSVLSSASTSDKELTVPQLAAFHSTSSTTSTASTTNSTDSTLAQTTSVALLVQLYKHFQSTGDSAGMEKIHQQLLALHSQLATKAGAYLNSLTTTTAATATTTTVPTNHLLPANVNHTTASVSVGTHNQSSVSTRGLHTQVKSTNSGIAPQLSVSNFQLHNPVNDKPLQPVSIAPVNNITPSTSANIAKSHPNASLNISSSSISTNPLLSYTSTLAGSSSSIPPVTGVMTNPLQFLTGNLLNTNQGSSSSKLAKTTDTKAKSVLPVNSPSIVTHISSSSSSTATGLSPLPGLQVTAQTQANVLRAVYSYRIQRIQEFLASLPPNQRPNTTQELRELLTKNNILTKAFPPDIITNLQQHLPAVTQSPILTNSTLTSSNQPSISNQTSKLPLVSTAALPTTTIGQIPPIISSSHSAPAVNKTQSISINNASSISHSVSTVNSPMTPSTITTTASATTNTTSTSASSLNSTGPLPGVTLETLRTLCRLPEADLIRIPMPSMLLTVVQYMRANKWNGSSNDLPILIQKAQEALAKGKLATATPGPTVQSSVNSSSVKSTSQQQLKQPTVTVQQQKSNNTSPLSQYMASVGMKVPTSVSSLSTKTTPKPPSNVPPLQNVSQNKSMLSEQTEKDRIAALQKVLQSSEEARIAFRFQAHLDKLHQQISSHEIQRPFSTWQDLILRLLPYHIYREPELPPGAMEKADAVYEGIAGVLLSRSQGLMNQYQQMLIREEQRRNEDEYASLVLNKLWLDDERERKEQEEKQKREAEQIAAELSVVGRGTTSSSFLDSTDPFLLESDTFGDYSFLDDQFWGDDLTDGGLGDINNLDLGIT